MVTVMLALYPQPSPGARAALVREEGQHKITPLALTLGHGSSGEPQHPPHISSLFDKCDCFSVPRGPGPSHLELSCIIRLHHLVRRGQFPSAFLNVSPHPNIRTPACTIQHFSVYKHHS